MCAIFSSLPSHKSHFLVINHVVVPRSSSQRHWVISLAVNKEKGAWMGRYTGSWCEEPFIVNIMCLAWWSASYIHPTFSFLEGKIIFICHFISVAKYYLFFKCNSVYKICWMDYFLKASIKPEDQLFYTWVSWGSNWVINILYYINNK